MWTSDDVTFDLRYEDTDAPIVTVDITTPDGCLAIMAEVEVAGRVMKLMRFHIHGSGPNQLGASKLRCLADIALERLEDYDVIEIEGATRTTGAGPGRRSGRLRFTRRPRHSAV